jgi:hypothetical protein
MMRIGCGAPFFFSDEGQGKRRRYFFVFTLYLGKGETFMTSSGV